MKRLTWIVLIFVCLNGAAQQSKNKLIYANGGLSFGNLSGGQIGISLATDSQFLMQLEYSGIVRKAKDSPEDYSGGLFSVFIFNANRPVDNIQSFRFLAGKILTKNPSDKNRFSLKAGISFSTYQEAYNFIEQEGLFLVPNYTWSTHTKYRMGVIVKPEYEIVFSKHAGLAFTSYIEISKGVSSAGLAVSLLLGKVWNGE